MKCLLIGGSGFIGSWLAKNLINNGWEVVIIDPFVYYPEQSPDLIKIVTKFRHTELLKGARIYHKRFEDVGLKLLKKEQPDAVVLLASRPLEKPFESEISQSQLFDDVKLTYLVVSALKQYPTKRFVFMSSISAYGDCDDLVKETTPLNPKTAYGISKATGEFLVKSQLENWNVIRTTSVYGFGDLNNRATQVIVNKALHNQKFWINDQYKHDFIYVKDLVDGITQVIASAPQKEIFHISGGQAYPLSKFVDKLKSFFELDFEIRNVDDRPRRGVLDNTKAKQLINWSPKMNLNQGIKDYMELVRRYKIA